MARHLKHRGVLSTVLVLAAGALVLLLNVPTQSVAQTGIGIESQAAELALLDAGDFTSLGQNCQIQCLHSNTECQNRGVYEPCGGTGSPCCCKWCGSIWGCYNPPCLGGP